MSVTNAKNNFFDRLLGKTSRDKSFYPQQEEQYQPIPGQQPIGAVQGTANAMTTAAGQVQNVMTSPTPQQPQQTVPTRYKLMEMLQPKPEQDQAALDIIQRRAKANAIGKGLSALAGLGGMAMGGDAPAVPDLVTPWNMNQMQVLDQDYRNRLQDWVNRSFQVDAANNQILNREIDQTIDAENRLAQIQLQGENTLAGIQARLDADMQKFEAKSFEDKAKELRDLGIDINDPKAYEKLLNIKRRQVEAELNYTQARTNWNNRITSGAGRSGGSGDNLPYSLSTLKAGRDARISALEQQKAEALKAAKLDSERQALAKPFEDQISELRKYKPGANPLIDAEIAELGYQMEEGGGMTPQTSPNPAQRGPAVPFDPKRGMFTNVPNQQDPVLKERISKGLQLIESGEASDEDFETILQDIVDAGEAEDLDAAYQLVYNLLKGNQ